MIVPIDDPRPPMRLAPPSTQLMMAVRFTFSPM